MDKVTGSRSREEVLLRETSSPAAWDEASRQAASCPRRGACGGMLGDSQQPVRSRSPRSHSGHQGDEFCQQSRWAWRQGPPPRASGWVAAWPARWLRSAGALSTTPREADPWTLRHRRCAVTVRHWISGNPLGGKRKSVQKTVSLPQGRVSARARRAHLLWNPDTGSYRLCSGGPGVAIWAEK